MIRPPGPVPETVLKSMPSSLATRFALGDASIRPVSVTVAAGCSVLISSEVILPFGPVPVTCCRSIPFSFATRFAFGDA